MKLATVENTGPILCIRRLNSSCVADIQSNIKIWTISLLFFSSFYPLSVAFNVLLKRIGSDPTNLIVSPGELLLLAPLLALAVMVGNRVDLSLLSPQVFAFDRGNNNFSVDGCVVSHLDKVVVRLQDGFGPSRRAFRLIATALGNDYVIAQTQRYTTAILLGFNEYPSIAMSEGLDSKYRFRRWADYAGAKTGFSSEWADYQEIFALHRELQKLTNTYQEAIK